jgi:hypothetical protein
MNHLLMDYTLHYITLHYITLYHIISHCSMRSSSKFRDYHGRIKYRRTDQAFEGSQTVTDSLTNILRAPRFASEITYNRKQMYITCHNH